MNWTAQVSTLVGAIVGVGATLVVELVRSKRDRGHQLYEMKRQLYARYLEALTGTDGELQMLAISKQTPVDEVEARTAWRSHSLLSLRYEVLLLAPSSVAGAADTAYKTLRAIRNAIGTIELTVGNPGGTEENNPGSAEWAAVHLPYIEAINTLHAAMRADVQRG